MDTAKNKKDKESKVNQQNVKVKLNESINESNGEIKMENENSSAIEDHPRMNELRQKVLEYIKDNEKEFHPDDIELIKTNNLWINRFLNFNGQSFESAFDHLIDTFKYRKESGIRAIDKSMFPIECWLSSTAYIYLPDKEGRPLLYIRVKSHLRGQGKFCDLFKQFLHVLIDEIDKLANREHGYSIFLDLCGMGFKNLDLDMLNYLVTVSRYRYPQGCKHCFIYGLPWALNFVVKSICATLPSDTSKKLKFLNGTHYDETPLEQLTSNFTKSTDLNNNLENKVKDDEKRTKLPIEEFIDINNVPAYLGGRSRLNYKIAPRQALSSAVKTGMNYFNYTEEETLKLIKPLKKVIDDAQLSYKRFKELNFEFEFDLANISQEYSKHLRL